MFSSLSLISILFNIEKMSWFNLSVHTRMAKSNNREINTQCHSMFQVIFDFVIASSANDSANFFIK